MAYEIVQNGKTQFAIDWDIVTRLTRSFYTAIYQWNYADEIKVSDSRWYNPFSWALPELSHLEVDWDRVRRDALSSTNADLKLLRSKANYDASGVARILEKRVEDAARYKQQFVKWMNDVQTQNMQNVEKSVEDYEADKEIAKFVRDRSYDMLMIGAAVMTGGEALAVMGGGSFLKGQAKFQDTGSVGAAAMEGAGSFVFAYVKLGKKFSLKQDIVLAFVQGTYKAGTELVGGATFSDAAVAGALTLASPGTDRLFDIGPGKTLFDKAAVPIVITYKKGGEKLASETVSGMMKSSAGNWVQGGIETKGAKLLQSSPQRQAAPESAQQGGPLINDATLTNKYLLYLAYVNMDKGIGRGW